MVFAGGKDGKYGRGRGEGAPERILFLKCPLLSTCTSAIFEVRMVSTVTNAKTRLSGLVTRLWFT